MERATEIFAAVNFFIIGLSHIVQSRAWVEFVTWLRGKGHAGVFVNGFLSLGFGSIIVPFHNVRTGLPTILTVIGWAQIVKAFVSFVRPHLRRCSLAFTPRRHALPLNVRPVADVNFRTALSRA